MIIVCQEMELAGVGARCRAYVPWKVAGPRRDRRAACKRRTCESRRFELEIVVLVLFRGEAERQSPLRRQPVLHRKIDRCQPGRHPVSYTHLTLPTIYS